MDKSLLIFIAIGLGALYLVTNFIGDIQAEDDAYRNHEYKVEHKYDRYQKIDSVGQAILSVEEVDENTQLLAWNASPVKKEFLQLFPNFNEMNDFVKDRVKGKPIKGKILALIKDIKGEFFSGAITADGAKQMLGSLK